MNPPGRVDRIAVHLHGGLVHWNSDGGPFAWFSNASQANGGFVHGSSFLNPGAFGSATYDYPNDQSARFLWYHDHAYGITRLNAYSGIASAYLITDDAETALVNSGVLPNIPGYPLGIPLILQDKTFFDPGSDPHYPVGGAAKGDLWYPWKYEATPPQGHKSGHWDLDPAITSTDGLPPISCIPESFSDTILVNGAPRTFRAPHGFRNPYVWRETRRLGYRVFGWTFGVWDSDPVSAETIRRRVRARLRQGAIILLHDGDGYDSAGDRRPTAAALPGIIADARDAGYTFLPLGALLSTR